MWCEILNFFFPEYCVGCGKYGGCLCEDCRGELPLAEQICPVCGRSSIMGWSHEKCRRRSCLDGLIVIYDYQDELVKKVVDAVKFGFNKRMINIVLKGIVFESGVMFDYLIPVPLHFYRENWRGFNQAEEIAREVAMGLGVPVVNGLERRRNTKQQSLIMDKKEREKNVKGAFSVAGGKTLKGKNVLLVDDVFTSGANMRECAKELKKAGAKVVWGLALGH